MGGYCVWFVVRIGCTALFLKLAYTPYISYSNTMNPGKPLYVKLAFLAVLCLVLFFVIQKVSSKNTPTPAPSKVQNGHDMAVEPLPNADPAAPAYILRNPRVPKRGEGPNITLLPKAAPNGGDLIKVELVVEEKLMTVANGFVQKVWTFGGTLPGPVIRTKVGDTVQVHLINPPGASVWHSIDFHASQVSPNDKMRSIAPGKDLIYEFTTDYAGIWMYHCGTDPVLHHIANGMFGMIIVEPAGGLPPLANEYFLVQHEWYLGAQNEISSLEKANKAAPEPDFVMFNGTAFQYKDNPIQVPLNEQIRLFVLNAGPSIDSSFHIVGTIFNTVRKEGVALEKGNKGNWGSQAVDLSPAQGALVEFQLKEDGMYPFVTHAFNFPLRGALGFFKGGTGDPKKVLKGGE